MRYFLNRVVLIATFAVASAYMYHSPLNLRCHLHDLRSSSLLQRKLATNHDSFDEEWGSTKTPILRAKSVAQFCFEVSCTIQSYQKTIEKLKRRKRELSTQMLIVDDQLSEMKSVEERHLRIPGIPDFVDIQRFSSSWWTSFPKTLHSGVGRINKHDLHSDNHAENIMILEERRKSLSDRALAIQNLLISLQVMENTGTISAKELTNQYRRITVAERINIFSPAAPKHHHANGITIVVDGDAWGSIQTSLKQPQPPRFPPTFTQFMVGYKHSQKVEV